jgi:hypothetical protein
VDTSQTIVRENQYPPPLQIREQRSAWFKERAKPGMTVDEALRLNDEALRLFPRTKEERRQKLEDLMAMPEFVL